MIANGPQGQAGHESISCQSQWKNSNIRTRGGTRTRQAPSSRGLLDPDRPYHVVSRHTAPRSRYLIARMPTEGRTGLRQAPLGEAVELAKVPRAVRLPVASPEE
jgi:hypothetical protein